MIDSSTSKLTSNVAKICSKWLYFFRNFIHGKDLNSILKDSDHLVTIMIKEQYLVDYFFVWRTVETFSWVYIPDHQHISENFKNWYLSSRQPWEARSWESWEKARLVTAVLWSLRRCLISLVSKSQMMTSAGNPGKLFWALARYLPSRDIFIPKFQLVHTWYFIIMSSKEGLCSW